MIRPLAHGVALLLRIPEELVIRISREIKIRKLERPRDDIIKCIAGKEDFGARIDVTTES